MHSSIRIPAILQDSVIKYTRLQSGRVPFSTFISYKSQEKLQVTILINLRDRNNQRIGHLAPGTHDLLM